MNFIKMLHEDHDLSDLLCDVCDVEILSEFETTAAGAAMIALYGQGIYSSLQEAVRRFVQIRMIIKSNQKNHEKYKELYRLYKEAYHTLKPLFPKRMELTERLYGKKRIKIENL